MRITKKDREEYKKTVQKTKEKVRKTVKKYGALIHDIKQEGKQQEVVSYDIREKLNLPSIESFKTRKEFNEFMYEQKKFTSGRSPHAKYFKNEHGAVMTDYLKMVLGNKHHKAEKERLKTVKRFEAAGLMETIKKEQMMMAHPSIPAFNPIKLDFNKLWNIGDIERKFLGLVVKGSPEDVLKKQETLKQNFISALQFAFNSDVDELVKLIEAIPAAEFEIIYLLPQNREFFRIEYIPSPQKEYMADMTDISALNRNLGMIYKAVGDYVENKPELAMLLKDF